MKRIAFYSGLFDPFTRGHLNIVIRTLRVCDKIIIAVENDKCTFDAETRIKMVEHAIHDLVNYSCGSSQYREEIVARIREKPEIIEVVAIRGEVVDTAIKCKANVMVRGIRNDYDRHQEEELADRIKLQFKIRNYPIESYQLENTNGEVVHMSSTVTKDLCKRGEYIAALHHVTPSVHNMLMEYYLKDEFDVLFPKNNRLWKKLCETYGSRRYRNFTHVGYLLNRLAIDIALGHDVQNINILRRAMFLFDVGRNASESANWITENLSVHSQVAELVAEADYIRHQRDSGYYSQLVRCDLLILTDEENYPLYCRLRQDDKDCPTSEGVYEGLQGYEDYLKQNQLFTEAELKKAVRVVKESKKNRS